MGRPGIELRHLRPLCPGFCTADADRRDKVLGLLAGSLPRREVARLCLPGMGSVGGLRTILSRAKRQKAYIDPRRRSTNLAAGWPRALLARLGCRPDGDYCGARLASAV